MSLPTRTLGRNGPTVPAQGLGLMGLSTFYGPKKSDEERLAFLDYAYKVGMRFWDSADVYGDSEDLLAKWFARTGKREDIFLVTKFGLNRFEDGPFIRGDPGYVQRAIERSLKRLQTDYVDLYYYHRPDPNTPIEATVRELVKLKEAGKIRHIGLSECSADTLRRAAKITQIAAYQVEYSPFFNDIEYPEVGILDAARENGIAIVAYSPLGRGLLTGKIKSIDDLAEDDYRRSIPRYNKPENFAKLLELVEEIRKLAESKGHTPGQETLAWVMAQGDDFIPIPGTSSIKNLDENMGALNIKLSKEEEQAVRKKLDEITISRERYSSGSVYLQPHQQGSDSFSFSAVLFGDTVKEE